jgi:hypothetical protein
MNSETEKLFMLTVRFSNCQRCTETDGKLSHRTIMLDCVIREFSILESERQPDARNQRWRAAPQHPDDSGLGTAEPGDDIKLSIHEADPSEEGIGSVHMLAFLSLNLPPATFAEFWAASAAADGATRDIKIRFKNGAEPPLYAITYVQLVEHMPEAVDFNPKAHGPGYIPGRDHPVVAELGEMRRAFVGSLRSTVGWLLYLAAIGLVAILLSIIVRAVWNAAHP